MFFLYCLCDPFTHSPRYVGITNNPTTRYSDHVGDWRHKNRPTQKTTWIQSLKNLKRLPTLKVLCVVETRAEAERLEILLIARWKNLTNGTTGGEGARVLTAVVTARMCRLGRPVSLETRIKLSRKNLRCPICCLRIDQNKPLVHKHGHINRLLNKQQILTAESKSIRA